MKNLFLGKKVIIATVAVLVIAGTAFAANPTGTNTTKNKPVATGQEEKTTNYKKVDESKILIRNDDGSVIAVTQKDIAKNPSLINKVITNPTASDYRSSGITPPATQNNLTQNVTSICANASPSNPYNIHKNEDGANHDNDQYCPTVESYCQKFPSQNICVTIKPTTPNPSNWTSYAVSASTNKTISDWVQVSQEGARKCTRAQFWFDKTGSTTPPAGWYLPIGILGFYHWWDAVPAEYGFCTYEKRMYTTHLISSQDDIYDGSVDGRVSIYTPYVATKKSYTFDSVYCTRYRVSWEPFQRADKSWWSGYRVYKDTIAATLVAGRYTYNNDFCKQLFDGTTTIDTTTINWTQFASDEYLNIGKQSISKIIDSTGSLTTPPAPQ